MRIQDKSIRQFTDKLAQLGSNELNDENVLKLLAAAGDTLDRFPEALRVALSQTFFGALTVTASQKNGIRGIAKPGEQIEANNSSTAPLEGLHLEDTLVATTADEQGRFNAPVPDVREGDLIRLRTRAQDGATSDWLTLMATGIEAADVRNATVNLDRIALADMGKGFVSFGSNSDQPITEPGATLRFVNLRTGHFVDVTATEEGCLPDGVTLQGGSGDAFSVAVSDGRNNTSFKQKAGTLQLAEVPVEPILLDLPDPAPLENHRNPDGTSSYEKVRFIGPLVVDGVSPTDVRQGDISNCYFPAALAAIAQFDRDFLHNMVKENGDGTFTVTFYERGFLAPPSLVEVTVDGDFYTKPSGAPLYGSSLGTAPVAGEMELWFPIIEKAYAQWKGSYETIGRGGIAGQVLSEVTGAPYQHETVSARRQDRLFEQILSCSNNRWPMTAGTYGEDESARYTNTGVYAWHAYSVLGAEEEHGVKYVTLRNPWGESEPAGNGPDDGIFRLELSEFVRLFQNFAYVAV